MSIWMKRFFFVLACMLVAWLAISGGKALAEDVTVNWSNPTGTEQCTDAGPLTNLAGTRIWQLVAEINDPLVETYTIPAQKPGDYTYVGTSFDDTGVGSRISGQTTKTVTEFIAPAGTLAYQPVSISSGWWMIPMATMNADTPCDVTQSANDYYRVPAGSYTWNPGTTARPVMLVAQCQ